MGAEHGPFGEARGTDQHQRDQGVEHIDPLREVAEGTTREPHDSVGEPLGDDDGNDDRSGLTCPGEAPNTAVQARGMKQR